MTEAVPGPPTAEASHTSAPDQPRAPISTWTMASFGAPSMPLSMVTLPLAVYLTPVYADSEGFALSLGFVGLMLFLSRIFDGVTDPIIGFVSDRIRTPWGRRKPLVLLGMPLFILGVWLLWVPPFEFYDVTWFGFTFSIGYPYLLAVLVLMYIGSTIKDVPYNAWGAELAHDYHERTLVMSWKEGFLVTGNLIGAFTPAIIVFWGYTRPTDNVYFLSVAVAIAMPLLVLNMMFQVPEPQPQESNTKRLSIGESFRYVWANQPYRMLVIIFLFSTIGAAMTNSLSFFFVKHVLLAGDLYGFYLAPYFLSQIVAIPLWFKLSRRIGKHRATMVAIFWYALWSCFIPLITIAPQAWFDAFELSKVLYLLPASWEQSLATRFEGQETGKFAFFIAIMCLKGSSIGALSALPYAMAADVVDLDTRQTGKRQGGAYFSIWTMTRKLAYAVGLLVGTTAATWVGFNALAHPIDSPNSWEALLWLACLYSVIPALFKFVAVPMLWNYSLTEERVRELQAEMTPSR